MAVEEVKDQNFREEIKTSPPKQACHQHLTLFFVLRHRSRGSDWVEVGRGSSAGRQCHDHDGGEGQHEVRPCLVLIKPFVSISKIH
jgi:hypothetical protein